MKNLKFKWLLLSFVLSIASINQVWADSWNAWGNFYFDTSKQGWSNVTLVIGRGDCSKAFSFIHLNNTNLYYQWVHFDNFNDMYFIGEAWDNDTDCNGQSPWTRVSGYSNRWQPWKGWYNESENQQAKRYYFDGEYTANKWYNIPLKTATIKIKKSVNGAAYTTITEGAWPAVINLKGTTISSYPTTTAQSNFNTESGAQAEYSSIPISGEVTMTLGADKSGGDFVFEGWGTGDEATITETPYTYNIQDNVTYYAFFRSPMYTVKFHANGGIGSMDDQKIYVSLSTALSEKGFSKTNYVFVGWATSQLNADAGIVSYTDAQSVTGLGDSEGDVVDLYAVWEDQWCIKGSGSMGSWTTPNGLSYVSGTTYSGSITLTEGNYEFKVYDRVNDKWYSLGASDRDVTLTRASNSASSLAENKGNLGLTADLADEEYIFTWNTTGNVISVTYPTPEYTITYKDQGNVAFTGTQSDPPTTHTYGTATTLKIPTKTGYDFAGWWTDAACTETQVGTNSAATLAADGYTADITLYAKWTAHTTTITLNDRSATDAVSPSSVTATYDSDDLSASITNPKKWGYTFDGWVLSSDGTGDPIIDTDGNLVEDIEDYTDGDANWIYDERTLTLYAKWTPSLYWVSGSGSEVTGTAFTDLGSGVYRATVTMSKDGTFHLGDGTTAAGPASNQSFATPEGTFAIAPSSYYFTYTGTAAQTIVCVYDYSTSQLSIGHVVFYLGAKGGSHAKVSDYEGWHSDIRTISGKFEYRMLVVAEDTWSSLCLPFGPTEVKVWSGSDYYDVYPYYRSGGTFYKGHYIIRTPDSNPIPLSSFGSEWKDPTSAAFKPSGGTPYIIQWHDNGYFAGKYISFFGNGASLAQYSGAPGAVAADDAHVNLYGNTAMTGLSVKNGYLLNDGVWTRGELGENAYVGPFECYIRASEAVAKKARRIQSGITVEDTATGWEDVLNSLEKPQIKVYNISGNCVAQYQNCSFDEAARRLSEEYREGVYILRAGNESVKLFVNGK